MRGVLDKLPRIKAELVSNKVGWQDWGFAELMEGLKNWTQFIQLRVLRPRPKRNHYATNRSSREETRRPRVSACIVKKRITDLWNARKLHLLVSASNNYKLRSYVLTARELNTRRVRVVAELLVSTAKGNIILQFAKMLVSYRQLHLYRMIGRPMKVRRFVTPLSL